MSITWRLYYIDLKRLQSFYGSGNMTITNQILEKYKDEMIYNKPIKLSFDFSMDYRDILTDIALGNCNTKKSIEYGYALKYLCQFFGDPVPQEQYVEYNMQWFTDLEVILPLIESNPPIPIPTSDTIKISYMTYQQIKTTIDQLKIYDTDDIIEPLYNENPEIFTARCAYVSWLKEVKEGEGIISFLYY
jgi:hypothetical protein